MINGADAVSEGLDVSTTLFTRGVAAPTICISVRVRHQRMERIAAAEARRMINHRRFSLFHFTVDANKSFGTAPLFNFPRSYNYSLAAFPVEALRHFFLLSSLAPSLSLSLSLSFSLSLSLLRPYCPARQRSRPRGGEMPL